MLLVPGTTSADRFGLLDVTVVRTAASGVLVTETGRKIGLLFGIGWSGIAWRVTDGTSRDSRGSKRRRAVKRRCTGGPPNSCPGAQCAPDREKVGGENGA